MLTTPHVLVGLVIYKLTNQPIAAFFLALLSHFLLDFFIPHWNPHIYTEMKNNKKLSQTTMMIIYSDVVIAVIITAVVAFNYWPDWRQFIAVGATSFGSILPDFIEIPYYFFGLKPKFLEKYVEFQHRYQANSNMFWGILTQIAVSLAAIKQLFL